MAKAPAYGAGDSRFESWRVQNLFAIHTQEKNRRLKSTIFRNLKVARLLKIDTGVFIIPDVNGLYLFSHLGGYLGCLLRQVEIKGRCELYV